MTALTTAVREPEGWRRLRDGILTPVGTPTPPGWSLLYETDFSTDDGWTERVETQSNDNSYNRAENVSYGPGGMTILGKREEAGGRPYTSGDVTGQHITVPNYFAAEVHATCPTEVGMWPAPMWFRPLNSAHGEIDVMESWPSDWSGTPRFSAALHRDYSLTPRHVSAFLDYSQLPNPDPAAPHTYSVFKTARRIEFFCDGIRTYCWEDDTPWSGTNRIGYVPDWYDEYMEVPERTWYPRITLQIGGTEAGEPQAGWDQSELTVHWLRIYEPEAA